MTVIPVPLAELVVDGISQLLAADMPDVFAVRTATGSLIPLTPAKLPTAPARAVAVAWYPLSASPTLSQSEGGIQFTSRSAGDDIRQAWATDELIRRALLGRYPLGLPPPFGVPVSGDPLFARISTLHWSSGGSLGVDEQNRWRVVSNFTVSVWDPTPHRF